MKEVTRIHIAKTSYDIEVPAKKELEKYINKLELYADDSGILEDIEIRITELLSERGVVKDGVITTDDVAALREQLGEPEAFADEGDVAVGSVREPQGDRRRLYRDRDGAMLGGVMSGIAKYFDVNPLWPRLLFIALLIISFGTAFIVYLVLWVAIPEARTAAEKLELEGKPVTLASIRERGATSELVVERKTPETIKKVLLFLAGLASAVMALGALLATIAVLVMVSFERDLFIPDFFAPNYEWLGWTTLALCVLAGLLLSALGVLLAYAAFTRKFTKRLGIATVSIVVFGIILFSSGVGTFLTGVNYGSRDVESAMQETKHDLPENFRDVKKLSVTAHTLRSSRGGEMELSVQYVVDSGTPRYELTSLPGLRPHVVVEGDEARIAFKSSALHDRFHAWVQPQLIIRGPALDELKVEQGRAAYSASYPNGQSQLKVETLGTTYATLHGQFERVEVTGVGMVDMTNSTVAELAIDSDGGSVEAGVVRSLTVVQPDVCRALSSWDNSQYRVNIRGVSSGVMTYNGQEIPAQTHQTACGRVMITSGEEPYED